MFFTDLRQFSFFKVLDDKNELSCKCDAMMKTLYNLDLILDKVIHNKMYWIYAATSNNSEKRSDKYGISLLHCDIYIKSFL